MKVALAAGMALVALAGGAAAAHAQWGQVRISGSVDEEVSQDSIRTGGQTFRTLSWGSRYAPNADGFILDPRLFTFSYSGAFIDRQTLSTNEDSSSLTLEPYRLTLTAFPVGLHTFTLRASRTASSFDLEHGSLSTRTDTFGGGWRYRGTASLPETTLDFTRETIEDHDLDGRIEEHRRSTLALRLHKDLGRFRPTFTYELEQRESEGVAEGTLPSDGIRHQVRFEDRIRVGQAATLTPELDYVSDPDGREAAGRVTLAGPLSPTMDGSTGLRYSVFDRSDSAVHTTEAQGQVTKRFTEDWVLTSILNGVFVVGGGTSNAWSAGGITALRGAPLPSLRGVADYGLTVSSASETTSVSHRGHVNLVSTILPRHTITGDYFVALTEAGADASFSSHTATLGITGETFARTTTSALYAFELQQGQGRRERQSLRLGADVRPSPPLLLHGGGELFTEDSTSGSGLARAERGAIADAAVTARSSQWLELGLAGRYGAKDVDREQRHGVFTVSRLAATAAVTARGLVARGEAFLEKDGDLELDGQGVRGSLGYRFRIWTISLDAEFSRLTSQGLETARDHLMLRITRPLDFVFP